VGHSCQDILAHPIVFLTRVDLIEAERGRELHDRRRRHPRRRPSRSPMAAAWPKLAGAHGPAWSELARTHDPVIRLKRIYNF
jgi:hypothetical protein